MFDVTACVLAIALNIPAFAAGVYAKSRTTNFRNIHIIFLSITDALVGVSFVPILNTFMYPEAKLWYWDCFGRLLFYIIGVSNSMAQVFAICLNRLFLMSKSSWGFSSDYISRYVWIIASTVFVVTVVCLITCIVLSTPSEYTITCRMSNIVCDNEQLFSLYAGVVSLILELLVVVCCLILICVLISHRRKMRRTAPATQNTGTQSLNTEQARARTAANEAKLKKETKSIQTIAIIVVLLVICMTPQNVGHVANGLGMTSNLSRTTRHAVAGMAVLNSAINPIIYCFMIPEMRQILRSVMEATGIM